MSLQAGIWNKKHLIRYLRDHEMPWQFETWGSIRSRRYKEAFYAVREGEKRVFEYPWGVLWQMESGMEGNNALFWRKILILIWKIQEASMSAVMPERQKSIIEAF